MNREKIIAQFIYGSTSYSAGYSVLGKSSQIESSLEESLIRFCEGYDQQLHSVGHTPYCLALEKWEETRVLLEIFGGWYDHVGRPSRILRVSLIPDPVWKCLGGNPFLLLSFFPAVKNLIPSKRDEIKDISPISLENVSEQEWAKLWLKETRYFLNQIPHLSSEKTQILRTLWESKSPCQNRELISDEDEFILCRLFTYALSPRQRQGLQFSTFSLNEKPPQGVCFRYAPYASSDKSLQDKKVLSQKDNSHQKIETILQAIPTPFNYSTLRSLLQRNRQRTFLFWFLGYTASFVYFIHLLPFRYENILSSLGGSFAILLGIVFIGSTLSKKEKLL